MVSILTWCFIDCKISGLVCLGEGTCDEEGTLSMVMISGAITGLTLSFGPLGWFGTVSATFLFFLPAIFAVAVSFPGGSRGTKWSFLSGMIVVHKYSIGTLAH